MAKSTKKDSSTASKGVGAVKDGLENVLTGKGEYDDPETHHGIKKVGNVPDEVLRAMYRGVGMAKAIVDRPVDRSMRVGFDIVVEDDEEGKESKGIAKKFKKVGVYSSIKQALKYERTFGGALLVMGVNDGLTFLDPLRIKDDNELEFIRVYRRGEVVKSNYIDRDPESRRYGMPEFYEIVSTKGSYKVHYSRVVELDGIPVDEDTYLENDYWGDSEIVTNLDAIKRYDDTVDNGKRIGNNFVNIAVEIDGLFDAIRDGEEDELRKRLRLFNSTLHSMNIAFHDKDEKIEKLSSVATGFTDILDRISDSATLSTGIPARILYGKQVGGLNNSGEGESNDWVEYIEDFINDKIIPVAEAITATFYVGEVTFRHREVKPQSAKESSETFINYAKGDEIYLREGALHPEEVRKSRFGGDKFGTSIQSMEEYDDVPFKEENEEGEEVPPVKPEPKKKTAKDGKKAK